jgi:hypothetical protein
LTPLLFLGLVGAPSNGLCLAGAQAETFLVQVGQLISSPDSLEPTMRRSYRIAPVPPAHVQLVINERVCAAASVAYAKKAGPAADKQPPFPVAVVATDDLFLVELGEAAGRDVSYWEVVIFPSEVAADCHATAALLSSDGMLQC